MLDSGKSQNREGFQARIMLFSLLMASLEEKRHTLAHLLAAAVSERYPHAKATIGPAIDNGFYYDFDFSEDADASGLNADSRGNNAPKEADLPALEEAMRDLLTTWDKMIGTEVGEKDARDRFAGNSYKLEIIDGIVAENQPITLYTAGSFTDLCRGGHSEHPERDLKKDSFILSRIAGAYWRGIETNPMLTRIYGLAFDTKEGLEAYQAQQEEAKKRDHRKIGVELDLFTFSPLVGSGLPLFTPKGTILREGINTFSQELRTRKGFEKVWIPHITKTDLYKTSGHWDKFGDELFLVKSQETSDEFVLKPMNCPHHTQIFASKPRSYRNMPIRYLDTTTVYRDEKKGELAGLSRVRSITQDDSHVFCREDQIHDEYSAIMNMVVEFYAAVGMKFRARLSFRDPKQPSKYLGNPDLWDHAEATLRTIAEKGDFDSYEAEGEAAFYGPKIDFMATDAIGREHQLATAQLDFVQPERFSLEYTDNEGKAVRPVMIHVAIAGSLERFLSVYIEHTAGNFPVWLAPVQTRIIPVSEKQTEYAKKVKAELLSVGVRVDVDDASESLGKRIRNAKAEKIPYLLVVGDKEIEENAVSVESREEKIGSMKTTEFVSKITSEIKEKK